MFRDAQLARADRALATELIYGVLRWLNYLDFLVGHFARREVRKLDPEVRIILRLGLYQMLFVGGVPTRAAVHEAVELAKSFAGPGTPGLVNGVLRAASRAGLGDGRELVQREAAPPDRRSLLLAHPQWFIDLAETCLTADEVEKLCEANNSPAPLTLRVNLLRSSPQDLRQLLGAAGATASPCRWAPEGMWLHQAASPTELPGFREGLFYIQDEGAMLISRAVGPQPGQTVIDGCAAPGGKSTHLAELMGDQGRVLAIDQSPERLWLVEDSARRLGHSAITTRALDARQIGREYPETADCLLLDVPCSGLGVIRRRPDIKWRRSSETLRELAILQREILAGAAPAVKRGGVLVYSTCSIAPQENQNIIEGFLADHSEFRPEPLLPGLPAAPGEHWVQLWPHRHGTDGFFIARLRRDT